MRYYVAECPKCHTIQIQGSNKPAALVILHCKKEGCEAARKIKARDYGFNLKILAITSDPAEASRQARALKIKDKKEDGFVTYSPRK